MKGPKGHKGGNIIVGRFCSMINDLKALVPTPTQKKGKKKIQIGIKRTPDLKQQYTWENTLRDTSMDT